MVTARANAYSGEPEEWATPGMQNEFGFSAIPAFDFFINWTTYSVQPEIWTKRLVSEAQSPWPILEYETLMTALKQCDQEDRIRDLVEFAKHYSLNLKIMMFPESPNWSTTPKPIVNLDLIRETAEIVELTDVMISIRNLSGGPVRIGQKGLNYGTSSLECYLSRTDALWPGDADAVLTDSPSAVKAIIEYKKHNLATPISAQKLSNYYPRPDLRKYMRLAMLRDYLDSGAPLLIVYYPTRPECREIKIERVVGQPQQLRSDSSVLCSLPKRGDDNSKRVFWNTLTGLL